MKLFIAERSSLAQAIAAGIGVGKKLDGYISVNGGKEIVTWCYGHILAQLNPDEYAERYRSWRMEERNEKCGVGKKSSGLANRNESFASVHDLSASS